MPSANANAPTHRSVSALQAVPDPTPVVAGRTVTEDKLWAALHAHPAGTTSDLAAHAGIGHSTAGKILAAWATDGSATRTPGPTQAGRRAADTWTITDTTQDHVTEPTLTDQPDRETISTAPDTDAGITGDTDTEEIKTSDPGTAEQPATPAAPTGTGVTASNDKAVPAQTTRLGKGALRGMVEDYLTERPEQQFSPSAIGKALGRSSGAVANALEKLVADGYAIQTQDKPKRFTAKATPASALG
ncbi:MAG: MarR family transcriptional regulator [Pseudonocardiaceae bacterium]